MVFSFGDFQRFSNAQQTAAWLWVVNRAGSFIGLSRSRAQLCRAIACLLWRTIFLYYKQYAKNFYRVLVFSFPCRLLLDEEI